jgi:hypothetical protein
MVGKSNETAMSMLNFYINRAGKNLPKTRKHVLERAKEELRDVSVERKSGARKRRHSKSFREMRSTRARNFARSALGVPRLGATFSERSLPTAQQLG